VPRSTFSSPYKEMLALLVGARREAGVTQVELSKRLRKQQAVIAASLIAAPGRDMPPGRERQLHRIVWSMRRLS
jgi:hypothetical protein